MALNTCARATVHSALVSQQAKQLDRSRGPSVAELCRYNFIDIAAALGVALLVNVAVMLVAAATFNAAGITVNTLQVPHPLPLLQHPRVSM
jgi:Mn2+/Fe2+ NRAMP family transporter